MTGLSALFRRSEGISVSCITYPFIELDQDDRSGLSVAGETLRINGNHWQEFRRILIFTFIYKGVPNWSHVEAAITINSKNQPDIEVRLDSHRNDQFMCAIAMPNKRRT